MNDPLRILLVFACLGSDEDKAMQLLAGELPRDRYRLDVVACFQAADSSEERAEAWRAVGVHFDSAPYHLSFEDTVAYLAGIIPAYDIIVSYQNVADIYPALERLIVRPPLIEHGASVATATAGPKHLTARYVAVSEAVFHAAAARMPGREGDVVAIPLVTHGSAQSVGLAWRRLFDDVAREARRPRHVPSLFASFVQGGFECSSHRRASDRSRLDIIALSRHDVEAAADYRLLQTHGIRTMRDGVRWHRVAADPGRYDWASLDPMLTAAAETRAQIIWDLMHYGWPDHIDIWSPDFPAEFAAFAVAAAQRIAARTPPPHYLCPINEISFLSWAGGEVAYMNPFARGRGTELKVQLVRALIAAQRAIRAVLPEVRFVAAEPLIHVVAHPDRPAETAEADAHRRAQFDVFDMIAGRAWPQLGGSPDALNLVGLNYYPMNNWLHRDMPIAQSEPGWRPLHEMLAEAHARTGRPLLLTETGCEDDARAGWFTYVAREIEAALAKGIPVEGICLYPVLGHVGWDDDRYCANGLIEAEGGGTRSVHQPLANALVRSSH